MAGGCRVSQGTDPGCVVCVGQWTQLPRGTFLSLVGRIVLGVVALWLLPAARLPVSLRGQTDRLILVLFSRFPS